MLNFSPAEYRLLMGFTFFVVGLVAVCAGIALLAFAPYRKEAQTLAAHTAKIGQKALTDNITQVAQSATALIEAVNTLMRTSSGNALALIVVGALFEYAAYTLLLA